MTFSEFKKWLTQLVIDKKGALPDLNDWKVIKEKLDSVKPDVVDYSGMISKLDYTDPNISMMDDMEYFMHRFNKSLGIPSSYFGTPYDTDTNKTEEG